MIKSHDDEDVQPIRIRRSHVFVDASRQFSKKSFNVEKMLRVQFIGEEAVDAGGPRRELFHLLMHEIFTSSNLFVGFPNNVIPCHKADAVANNMYYNVGKMISTCIVQGGEVPVCFAKAVADYLIYDEVRSPVCLDDIPSIDVREHLHKVAS